MKKSIFPDLPQKNLQKKFDNFPWQENNDFLIKWQKGMTGYPIVDAGMRELWQTGFIHNRVRMIVASFLIKHLMIDWRQGLEWFHDCLVDADTAAFNKIMEAFALPKSTAEEKTKRTEAIQAATKYAIEIPFKVMQTAAASMELVKAMATIGNPNSVSDAGVGALCIRSAVMGAFMNVRINSSGYNDKAYVDDVIAKGKTIEDTVIAEETAVLKIVNEKIGL